MKNRISWKKIIVFLIAFSMMGSLAQVQVNHVHAAEVQDITLSFIGGAVVGNRYWIDFTFSEDIVTGGVNDYYYDVDEYLVDGVNASTNIYNYDSDSNDNKISIFMDSPIFGADTSAGVTDTHTLIIPKGTVIGTAVPLKITQDFAFMIQGTTIKQMQLAELTYTTAGVHETFDRYDIHFTIEGATVTEGNPYYYDNKVVVDKVTKSGDEIFWLGTTGGTDLTMYVSYNIVQAGATSYEDIGKHILSIPAGTILGNATNSYYGDIIVKNTIMLEIEGYNVKIYEPEGLPDEIIVPMNDYRNDHGGSKSYFYFKTSGSDTVLDTNADYSFSAGGIYLNGNLLAGVGVHKYWDGLYSVSVGGAGPFKANDKITIDGTVKSGDSTVKFQNSTFIVDENLAIFLFEGDEPRQCILDDLYVDLSGGTYTIPDGDKVQVNTVPVVSAAERTLTKAGEYDIVRVSDNTTYEQDILCYTMGDANSDGKALDVRDLVAAKRIKVNHKEFTSSDKYAADITNDGKIEDVDMELLRQLLVGTKNANELRQEYHELVIGAISDTHLGSDFDENGTYVTDLQRRKNLEKALTYYKHNNVKFIIVNGDITDCGSIDGFATFWKIVDKVWPEGETAPTFMPVAHGHDYWYYDAGQEELQVMVDRFVTGMKLDTLQNHKVVNGYDFISLAPDVPVSDDTEGRYAVFSDEAFAYLSEELAKAAERDPNKPIFVATHRPQVNTTFNQGLAYPTRTQELYEILAQYPQVVLFTGHSHFMLQDERSIAQIGFTAVNTSTTYYVSMDKPTTYVNEGDWNQTPGTYQFAQGLLLKIKGTNVDIYRRDFYYDKQIGEVWNIADPKDKTTWKYTENQSGKTYNAPVFATGTEMQTQWVTKTACIISFPSATHDNFVYRYNVIVKNSAGVIVHEYQFVNDFYHDKLPEIATFTVPGLDCNSDYTFVITAEETYGAESTAIEGNITAYTY